jgi:hypothetical protein
MLVLLVLRTFFAHSIEVLQNTPKFSLFFRVARRHKQLREIN